MAVTWTIAQLDRNSSDDGVIVAHYRCNDSEEVGTGDDAVTHYGSSYGTCSFTPDSTADGYTAYAEITEVQAVQWCKDAIGADAVTAIEASIAAQIADSKAPASLSGVPW
jgi:hypothetical protein